MHHDACLCADPENYVVQAHCLRKDWHGTAKFPFPPLLKSLVMVKAQAKDKPVDRTQLSLINAVIISCQAALPRVKTA